MFTPSSAIVQLYVKRINEGTMTIDDVPTLFNLKDVVASLI